MKVVFNNNFDELQWKSAKNFCYEKHLEDYPKETDYEPSSDEIEEEINIENELCWEDVSSDLRNFFDKGDTYILRGNLGLWNGKEPVGAIIHNYQELTATWNNMNFFKIFDDNGKFFIDAYHHDGTNTYAIKRLSKKGKELLKKESYKMETNPLELYNKLWEKENSFELNFYKKIYG